MRAAILLILIISASSLITSSYSWERILQKKTEQTSVDVKELEKIVCDRPDIPGYKKMLQRTGATKTPGMTLVKETVCGKTPGQKRLKSLFGIHENNLKPVQSVNLEKDQEILSNEKTEEQAQNEKQLDQILSSLKSLPDGNQKKEEFRSYLKEEF